MELGKSYQSLSRREFLLLGGRTAGVLLLLPCPVRAAEALPSSTVAASTGGVLHYAHLGDFVGFDGHRLHAVSFPMFNLLYNSLVVLDKSGRPQAELADSWRFSGNLRTLTLTLRQGVKFHSGRQLVSEDVKLNIERMQNPANSANARPLASLVEKIETPDRRTVVLKLGEVSPNIFDLLDLTYIMDPECFSDVTAKGAGTGPFMLESRHPGEPVRFSRFPSYFKTGLPILDEVIVHVPPDPTSMIIGIENGDYDVIERFQAADADRLKHTKGIRVNDVFAGFISDILINTRQKPFDRNLVRQALSHAVNRQLMIDAAMGGIGQPMCLPFPKSSLAYNTDLEGDCRFDPAESKRLLDKAGLGGGFSFELLISTEVLPASPIQAEILKADLAAIGVQAVIADVGSAEYFARHTTGKYEVALHQFRGANRDPKTLFLSTIPWYTRENFSNFTSPEYARLVEEAGRTADIERRKALYKKIGKLILDEAFVICIAPAPSLFAFGERVKGLDWNVEGHPKFERVSLA
ncbi:MAG: ABC transporter substrate-binding protein [Deltaproteobacteria bacterium]|nr:ABC transporter substrate-binding protein [Deltaproteobacteria bacterium]